jgi:hypothetical protein
MPTALQILYEVNGLLESLRRRERWRKQVEDVPELVTRMMWRRRAGNGNVVNQN